MSENRLRLVFIVLAAQIFGALPQGYAQQPASSLSGTFKAYAGDTVKPRVSDFSGLPVPRYSSLKFPEVNGRAGPSPDYPVAWSYHRQGLPVVIVRESDEWTKIRDPQGDEVWVLRRMLAGERTTIATAEGAIRKKPKAGSAVVAKFAAGAVMHLTSCGETWCQVEAEGRKGWAPRTQLWGVDELPAAR